MGGVAIHVSLLCCKAVNARHYACAQTVKFAGLDGEKPTLATRAQILPTVFSLTRGWISPCDITGVCERKHTTFHYRRMHLVMMAALRAVSPQSTIV
jgi:hypothetical protein